MKKIALLILMICMTLLFQELTVRAEGEEQYPLGKNYLDLSNLIMKSDDSHCAYTENPIFVKGNHEYTIVLDFDFLGQHSDWLGDIYLSIEEIPSYDTYDFLMLGDYVNERAYIEFIPNDDYVFLTSLPMIPTGYNAIMYEGSYADFSGFEPFIDPNETMSYQGVLPIDYDEPMTLAQIESYIHAEDPYGNPIGITVETDDYSNSTMLPGNYEMIFMTSFNQIIKTYHLEVRVFDSSSPIIVDPGIISIPLSEKILLDDILQTISVSDNVDSMSANDLVVIEDTYSVANSVGSYNITVEAEDSSLNVTSLSIRVDLVDMNGPTIIGPEALYLYTIDLPLSNQEIREYFTIIDDVDGTNVSVQFINDTYQQTQEPGVYGVTIKAFDTLANSKTRNITIHVIENRGPVFSTDEIILSIDAANLMTDEDLIEWFTNHTLSLGHDISSVSILYNEYENHSKEEGNYYVYMNYELNGETQTSRIRVDVQNANDQKSLLPYLAIGIPAIVGITTLLILVRKK